MNFRFFAAVLFAAALAAAPVPTAPVSDQDSLFLEDMQRRSFQYFWDHTNPANGLTDRAARWHSKGKTRQRRFVFTRQSGIQGKAA